MRVELENKVIHLERATLSAQVSTFALLYIYEIARWNGMEMRSFAFVVLCPSVGN